MQWGQRPTHIKFEGTKGSKNKELSAAKKPIIAITKQTKRQGIDEEKVGVE